MALFADPIEIHRAPLVVDGYGKRRDWTASYRVWSGLGAALPYRRMHRWDEVSRETTRGRSTIYLPGAVDFDSADRILLHEVWWEPDGEAWPWRLGARRYIMIHAKRIAH